MARGPSIKRQKRLEDLAERIGMGPITYRNVVKKHAERHGITLRLARDDHAAAGAVLVELSKARVVLNHGLMESHLSRTLALAEEAYRDALNEYRALMARCRAIAELAEQAESEGDIAEASELWSQEERIDSRAIQHRNSAANMLRSMAPAQSRLMKLQGLGRPETMADVVDTVIQIVNLPLPSTYEGGALPDGDDLSGIEVVDAEFVDAT